MLGLLIKTVYCLPYRQIDWFLKAILELMGTPLDAPDYRPSKISKTTSLAESSALSNVGYFGRLHEGNI